MLKTLQFGKAWIDMFTRILGSSSSDDFLRHGVGVKNSVYNKWLDKWKTEGRGTAARTYLTDHLDEILTDAARAPGCPVCGTERGMHASYCPRRGTR